MDLIGSKYMPELSRVLGHPAAELDTEQTNEVFAHVAIELLSRISCTSHPAWYFIARCVISSDFSALCLGGPDVLDQSSLDSLSAEDVYLFRQCYALFSKRADIDLGVDREARALEKFREAEDSCRRTNSTFVKWNQGDLQFSPVVESVLHLARWKISNLLGSYREDGGAPSLDDLRPRFGPGASTQTPKKNACIAMKLRQVPACSDNLEYPGLLYRRLPFTAGNPDGDYLTFDVAEAVVSFVPKNAKIDRAICTEPQMNSMWQLALGDILADLLRKVGIDIRDQGRNQHAAFHGSVMGTLATIDLSMASDTVSYMLVEHLLPGEWFDLICSFRSGRAALPDGSTISLEKISSMGNGFTFPLETLIFWALAQSVTELAAAGWLPKVGDYPDVRPAEKLVLAYGDDIVVPVEVALPLIDVLVELGFSVNTEKSFTRGPFRESCGTDYFLGTNVRPVFQSGNLTAMDCFRLHNYFLARGEFRLAAVFEELLHPSIRLRGPKGLGDGHLHGRIYISRPVGRKKGWSGYGFDTWTQKMSMLKDHVATRMLEGKLSDAPRKPVFRSQAYVLVKRIATYVAYRREARPRETEAWHC